MFLNRPSLSVELAALLSKHKRPLLLFAVLVIVMQFSDPLGDVSLWQSALFWSVRLLGVAASLVFAEWLLSSFFAAMYNRPRWLKPVLLSVVLAAIPMAVVEFLLEGAIPQSAAFDDSALRQSSPLAAWLTEYLTILSIILPVNVILWLALYSQRTNAPHQGREPESAAAPDFLQRADGIAVDDVLALSAEEHYVRIIKHQSDELVYCRFSDAVAQMPNAIGLQVHRSWWVAERAVVGAQRGVRRYRVQLSNGAEVPISDSYVGAARARGLLRKRQPRAGKGVPSG